MSLILCFLRSIKIEVLGGALHGWSSTTLHFKTIESSLTKLSVLLNYVKDMQGMVFIEFEASHWILKHVIIRLVTVIIAWWLKERQVQISILYNHLIFGLLWLLLLTWWLVLKIKLVWFIVKLLYLSSRFTPFNKFLTLSTQGMLLAKVRVVYQSCSDVISFPWRALIEEGIGIYFLVGIGVLTAWLALKV